MRRKDREITDFNEIMKIIDRCDVCRVAVNDEALSFGRICIQYGYDEGDKCIPHDCTGSDW
mgnify:CR=1 FL=1